MVGGGSSVKRKMPSERALEMGLQASTSLSASSKQRYRGALEQALRVCGEDRRQERLTLPQMMMDVEGSYARLDAAIPSRESLRTVLTALISTLKNCRGPGCSGEAMRKALSGWRGKLAPVSADLIRERETNVGTPAMLAAKVSWSEVVDVLARLSREEFASRTHLLLAMYSMIPPRRQADYYRVSILEVPPVEEHRHAAWLVVSQPMVLVVREYKTAKSYAKWTKELPAGLSKVVRASLVASPRGFLFQGADGRQFSTVEAYKKMSNRVLKSLFGPDASVNSLRHSYATYVNQQNPSLAERKRVARDMGHSLMTSLSYSMHLANES
jgi:hypothetical protein